MEQKNLSTFDWFSNVTVLKGIGNAFAEKLAKLDIYTLGDLLLHCPHRYEDRTKITPIGQVRPAQTYLIQGEILDVREIRKGKKRCQLTLGDESGQITIQFFHYYLAQLKLWQKGIWLRCYGTVTDAKGAQIFHPDYEIVSQNAPLPAKLTPFYPSVANLPQKSLRRAIATAVNWYLQDAKSDPFAISLTSQKLMLSMTDALQAIHFPSPCEDINALLEKRHPAFTRLIGEELTANHLTLKELRTTFRIAQSTPFELPPEKIKLFCAQFPFALTLAQESAWQEIKTDLAKSSPMLRLLQGDVGCGKTVVAALSALAAVHGGAQVAIMAPTEILAKQLHAQFNDWFGKFFTRCDLLTGGMPAKIKRSLLENICLGLSQIVIGTHALFQEEVVFKKLGLVIIDEQHRFGVHQRYSLQMKGQTDLHVPHQLVMTATPIPRTLMLGYYAHLEISTIDALPQNRQPITTLAIPLSRRSEVIERIKAVIEKNQQIYWVCTLIDESEKTDQAAAEKTVQILRHTLPEIPIGLVHGRLPALEKEMVMESFYQGELSILVATSVIEVGVNVPKATLMIIENAERLGLSQLHQLRGRVGRGSEKSFCVLLYSPQLSAMAKERLAILRETNDGFVIAQKDLELRGPGELLGARQAGAMSFKLADLHRDQEILQAIPSWEDKLNLTPKDRKEMMQRWSTNRCNDPWVAV